MAVIAAVIFIFPPPLLSAFFSADFAAFACLRLVNQGRCRHAAACRLLRRCFTMAFAIPFLLSITLSFSPVSLLFSPVDATPFTPAIFSFSFMAAADISCRQFLSAFLSLSCFAAAAVSSSPSSDFFRRCCFRYFSLRQARVVGSVQVRGTEQWAYW